jgi:hypothetical protein
MMLLSDPCLTLFISADACQHGDSVSLSFNESLIYKYIKPGKWYINFMHERHLSSDPKLISFSVTGNIILTYLRSSSTKSSY